MVQSRVHSPGFEVSQLDLGHVNHYHFCRVMVSHYSELCGVSQGLLDTLILVWWKYQSSFHAQAEKTIAWCLTKFWLCLTSFNTIQENTLSLHLKMLLWALEFSIHPPQSYTCKFFLHENSEELSSATSPKPKGNHPIACSGKPNPSKR